jgi:hypothetical protein
MFRGSMRCDNLIAGMPPRKQNLLTCVLVTAVAFECSPCEAMHFVR